MWIVLDALTKPQTFDVDAITVAAPTDGSVDLGAFTVDTPDGPVGLDALAKAGEEYLHVELEDVLVSSVSTTESTTCCITVFHVTVCATSVRLAPGARPPTLDLEAVDIVVPLDGSVDLASYEVETAAGVARLDELLGKDVLAGALGDPVVLSSGKPRGGGYFQLVLDGVDVGIVQGR